MLKTSGIQSFSSVLEIKDVRDMLPSLIKDVRDMLPSLCWSSSVK